MSHFKVMQPRVLPRFETLKFIVAINQIASFRELASIYSWCYMNCTEWNLQITNNLEDPGVVLFGFNDELEALMFKLTWAC
jgi:hypothetical protein